MELIPMPTARRPACSEGDMSAARCLEMPSASWKDFFPGRRVMKRGHRGDFATPMDHPGRLALLSRALPANVLSRSADSRRSREVSQASRKGLSGIF